MNAANAKDMTPSQNAMYSIAGFVYLFMASLVMGIIIGLFTAYLLKVTRENSAQDKIKGEQLLHFLIMLVSPIISYLAATVFLMR